MPIQEIEKTTENNNGKESTRLTVTEGLRLDDWAADRQFAVVGKPHSRVEGSEKVTGRARYAYDVRLPGQLYAAVLRSPHPHADISGMDTSKAEALDGVHAVLTHQNAGDIDWYENSKLLDPHLRFVGDEVAAVAADSIESAQDALRLIDVRYEPLPFVLEPEQALADDAPSLHPGGNRGEPDEYSRGDVEAGFADADVIVEAEFVTATQIHNSLEPHGCTALWEREMLTLWESTQGIFSVREDLAQKLGLDESQVRVRSQHMGGGFGAKQVPWKQTALAALLSKATGRPVQLMLDRRAESLGAGNRNATRQRVRLAAKRDGTLTGIELSATMNVGAYSVGGEGSNVAGIFQHLYRCPNVRTHTTPVYTNLGPAVAFRAPGYVEGAFALESAMDELARKLEMDPVALRRKNYAEQDQKQDQPWTSPDGLRVSYQRVVEAFGWDEYQRPPASGSKRRGIGFAAHEWAAGGGNPPGYAWIKLNSDGSADVITGVQDIGTGSRTGMSQIAAEELGLPMAKINLHLGDTSNGPYGPTSAGSATLATLGPAIRAAAVDVKRQLCRAAAKLLDVDDPDFLEVKNGVISLRESGASIAGAEAQQISISVAEVAKRLAPTMLQGWGERRPNPSDKTVRTFGAQAVEVEVDTATGEVTVLRVVAAHDCGRIVNPKTVDSQIIGGVTQGIGFGLMEEQVVDSASGVVLNPNLEEYKVPTVADIPPITHNPVDLPDLAANNTGAKGVGEPPLIPTAPAIANAIYDAVGVRIRQTPLNRWRLLNALAEQR